MNLAGVVVRQVVLRLVVLRLVVLLRGVTVGGGRVHRRGLVGALSGNASLRLEGRSGEGLLLVTPTQLPYYHLKPEDLVVVDLNGELIGEGLAPSSETAMHLEIYRKREDVAAVIHTHSISASAAAAAGRGGTGGRLGGEGRNSAGGPAS